MLVEIIIHLRSDELDYGLKRRSLETAGTVKQNRKITKGFQEEENANRSFTEPVA